MATRMPTRFKVTMRTHVVFASAHDVGDRLGHAELSPVHVLLAIIREGRSPAVAVLDNLGVRLGVLEKDLEAHLPSPAGAPQSSDQLSWTESDDRMLHLAESEAHELGHPYQGCEHLLLAFLRDTSSALSQLVGRHGVDYGKAKAETLRLLGTPRGDIISKSKSPVV